MQRINFQEITKADKTAGDSLLVHSIFRTIQGEGPNVGQPSIFVRLGGCNLQCPGCDTEYTKGTTRQSLPQIMVQIIELSVMSAVKPLIVITGGEPFRQSIVPFINMLFVHDFRVQIETNGTLGIDRAITLNKEAWRSLEIVVSPKAGKVHESLYPFIIAYKYVASAGNIDSTDGLPTTVLGLPGRPARPHGEYEYEVFLQPADEVDIVLNKRNTDAVIKSCMRHGYSLCLQTHKFVNLP